jgi:hypothetical protein
VRQLLPGDIKGWAIGTELDREGFKHIMHIELRRLRDSLDFGWERTEEKEEG